MIAGTAKIDITPAESVWMEGMIRAHKSEGVHDPLYARTLVISNTDRMSDAYALVSVDVCMLDYQITSEACALIESETSIPPDNTIIAATHTHSGPATIDSAESFQPAEQGYVRILIEKIARSVNKALLNARPALIGTGRGSEDTISRYRRFMSEDGKIVMIWERNPDESPMRCLGKPDPAVGVLKVVDAADPAATIAVLFNHAGHPNVMSGDNYMISADYAGVAAWLVEEHCGCSAMFFNGAQGTMDIDNWRYRDWDGMKHLGSLLAGAVSATAEAIPVPASADPIRSARVEYSLAPRTLTDAELAWADAILAETGGRYEAVPDGVGDDFKALLYRRLYEKQSEPVAVEQTAIAIGDTAFITFPGELFTEIGMAIKQQSPFAHTCILGLANGYIGYIPTREAVAQGGYEVDTRRVSADAEDTIVEHSLKLLDSLR